MPHHLIISDIPLSKPPGCHNTRIIFPGEPVTPCIGCFGCWVKTPGQCVRRDSYQNTGAWLADAKKLILISRCVYGSLSPFIKSVLDRAISYVQPYFEIYHGEMHHRRRYPGEIELEVLAYGQTSDQERNTLRDILTANAVNLHGRVGALRFFNTREELPFDQIYGKEPF